MAETQPFYTKAETPRQAQYSLNRKATDDTGARGIRFLVFAYNRSIIFILSQPDKPRMLQVPIRRPFGELYLRYQLRFEPDTVLHLFLGQSPLGALFLGQI